MVRPILTLTLSLTLSLTLTLTLTRCDGAAKSALPEGGDPKECQAAGDVTDDWCVSNCGFTPPNCPEALCKCAKPSDKGASAADTSKAQAEGKPTLSPFAKAFERKRNENAVPGAAPDAEQLLRDMAKSRHKEGAQQAKQEAEAGGDAASQQQQGGEVAISDKKGRKKTDKEIYLETCEKHPTTPGCPTCEELPTMAYCGLDKSAWQDLSGLPKGADPNSCAPVGDVTKEWCVMNCGGTPPNCPSAQCKCKAPEGAQEAPQQQAAEQTAEPAQGAEQAAQPAAQQAAAEPAAAAEQAQGAQSSEAGSTGEQQQGSTAKTEQTWLERAQEAAGATQQQQGAQQGAQQQAVQEGSAAAAAARLAAAFPTAQAQQAQQAQQQQTQQQQERLEP